MLFLVGLFFVTCSYACEDTIILEVVIKDKSKSRLLKKTKAKYDKDNEEYWEHDQVYFYNPNTNNFQFFNPNTKIINLFSSIQNEKLSTITHCSEIQKIFQDNQLYPDFANNFDLFFKNAGNFNLHFTKRILYYFKLFFYTIESNQDPSMRVTSYNDFLRSASKYALNVYNVDFLLTKKVLLGLNGLMITTFGTAGVGLSVADPSGLSTFIAAFGMPPFVLGLFSIMEFFQKYYAYKTFLETIETLEQKIQE